MTTFRHVVDTRLVARSLPRCSRTNVAGLRNASPMWPQTPAPCSSPPAVIDAGRRRGHVARLKTGWIPARHFRCGPGWCRSGAGRTTGLPAARCVDNPPAAATGAVPTRRLHRGAVFAGCLSRCAASGWRRWVDDAARALILAAETRAHRERYLYSERMMPL